MEGLDSWNADIGDAVLEGPLRVGDCNGVSNSNSGFEVIVGGMAGTIGGVVAAGACDVLSKAEKSQVWAAGAAGGNCVASAFAAFPPRWSSDDTASRVKLVSLAGAGEAYFSPRGLPIEPFVPLPTSNNPLTGRLVLGGEATISPHSSSSSSSSTSGTETFGFSGDGGRETEGGANCKEFLLAGSLTLAVLDLLTVRFADVTSIDCLTPLLGGRVEAGVTEADPSVTVLQPKAGLLGGAGMPRGDGGGKLFTPGDLGSRLLTPGDRGGRLLTPADRFRE